VSAASVADALGARSPGRLRSALALQQRLALGQAVGEHLAMHRDMRVRRLAHGDEFHRTSVPWCSI